MDESNTTANSQPGTGGAEPAKSTDADERLTFRLHLNVLHHLGMKLYSTAPSVLTELVANSWDADATRVSVAIDVANNTLTVEDDGHGMDRRSLQERFLSVGYSRRDYTQSDHTVSGARRVMGRKGIGKLAMFSIARRVEVTTQAQGQSAIKFAVDVDALEQKAKDDQPYFPEEYEDVGGLPSGSGTRIVLSNLGKSVNRSRDYLVPRLARRFGIIGPHHNFAVSVDGIEITRRDAGIHENLQFLWYFDQASYDEAIAQNSPLAHPESLNGKPAAKKLSDIVAVDNHAFRVRGFIGTVDVPSKLGPAGENINHISLFANGRLWQEDLLSQIGDTRYFNSYIVGEIHADFLDSDGVDRATSAREAVIQHDPYYQAIIAHLTESLASIRDQWDLWRGEVGGVDPDGPNDVLEEWVESLDKKTDRALARKLIRSIDKVEFNNDPERNRRARAMLYRSTMVAFEKLRVRNALQRLELIDDVLSPEFQSIFSTLDDVEESHYYEISHGRLEIIQAFEQKVDDKELEKVVQTYLLKHLWLLDPTWDRIGGSTQSEITLSEELKKADPDADGGARLDIAYRQQSGRNVVIELKRPGLKVPFAKIIEQCDKYRRAVEQFINDNATWMDGGGAPGAVSIYFVCSVRSHLDDTQIQTLDKMGVKVLTYGNLIQSARAAYEAYFKARGEVKNRLENFLNRIDVTAGSKNQSALGTKPLAPTMPIKAGGAEQAA